MSLFGDGKREALLAILVLLVLVVIQHAPGLFFAMPRHLDASVSAAEGAINQRHLVPAMAQAGAAVREGALPTWNPTSRLGEPFSLSGAPVLYAPFWLLALHGGRFLVELLMCLHAFLACFTMFRFLRSLTLSRYVAFLGGGAYGLGWFFVANLGRLPEAAAAAWLPLVLELAWRTLRGRQRARNGPWLGLVLAVTFTTGGTSTAWVAASMALAVVVSGLPLVDREARAAGLRQAALAGVIALVCTAPLWLDWLQLRGEVWDPVTRGPRRLQIEGLAALAGPALFQSLDGAGPAQLELINPGADPLELALYPGALVLFAVLLGLFRPKRTLRGLFWLFTMAAGVVLTLDGPIGDTLFGSTGALFGAPGVGLLLLHLGAIVLGCTALENFFDAPVARRFSVPLTAAIAAAASVALLAITWLLPTVLLLGLTSLERHDWGGDPSRALGRLALHLLPVALTTLLLAGVFPFWRRLGILRFKWIVGTIALAELVLVGLWLVPRQPEPELNAEVAEIADRLPRTDGRVLSSGSAPVVPGSLLAAEGLRVVDTDGPGLLDRTARLLQIVDPGLVRNGRRPLIGRLAVSQQFDDPLLEIGAVDIALARGPIRADAFVPLTAAPTGGEGAGDPDRVRIAHRRGAEVGTAGARARIWFEATPVADREEAAAILREASDGDHSRLPLVVENAPANFHPRPTAEPVTVEIVDERSDRIELSVDVGDGRGYLVLADAWGPGWLASVDGQRAPVLPAWLAFRAVPLREGEHRVVLQHEPWSERFGLPLAALGVTIVLLLHAAWMLGLRR